MFFDLLKTLIALHPANDNRRLAEPSWVPGEGTRETTRYTLPDAASDDDVDD